LKTEIKFLNEKLKISNDFDSQFKNENLKIELSVLKNKFEISTDDNIKFENELSELKYELDELKSLNDLNQLNEGDIASSEFLNEFLNTSVISLYSKYSSSSNNSSIDSRLEDRDFEVSYLQDDRKNVRMREFYSR
jgi:hypothetical protein